MNFDSLPPSEAILRGMLKNTAVLLQKYCSVTSKTLQCYCDNTTVFFEKNCCTKSFTFYPILQALGFPIYIKYRTIFWVCQINLLIYNPLPNKKQGWAFLFCDDLWLFLSQNLRHYNRTSVA